MQKEKPKGANLNVIEELEKSVVGRLTEKGLTIRSEQGGVKFIPYDEVRSKLSSELGKKLKVLLGDVTEVNDTLINEVGKKFFLEKFRFLTSLSDFLGKGFDLPEQTTDSDYLQALDKKRTVLVEELKERIKEINERGVIVLWDREAPLGVSLHLEYYPTLALSRLNGIKVDVDYLERFISVLEKDKEKLIEVFEKLSGSRDYRGGVFKDVFVVKGDKIEVASYSKSNLNRMKAILSPHQRRILKVREEILKLDSMLNAAKGLLSHASSDGTVRPIIRFKKGRFASSSPNVMGLPRDYSSEILGKTYSVRRGIVPKRGKSLIKADVSQMELLTVCVILDVIGKTYFYEGDRPSLKTVINRGVDVHYYTASKIFKKIRLTSKEREVGKAVNFSMLYGGADLEKALSEFGGFVTVEEAKRAFYEACPDVEVFHSTFGMSRGLQYNIFGYAYEARKRTEALNYPVQSSATYLLMAFLANFVRGFDKGAVLYTVHDEVVIETENVSETVAAYKSVVKAVFSLWDLKPQMKFRVFRPKGSVA